MTPFDLIKLAAAAWYIAYVITQKPGPFAIFQKLRNFRGGRWHGRTIMHDKHMAYDTGDKVDIVETVIPDGLLDCIICFVVWVALALLLIPPNIFIDACAVAGVALWAMGITTWRSTF